MELMDFMDFMYIDAGEFTSSCLAILGICFCGGFVITTAVHIMSFAIFGLFKLVHIE